MLHLKRVLLWAGFVFSALVVAVICVVLSAPLWINEAAVKSEIAGLVSRATGDILELDRLQLDYFPLPGVVISRPKYSVPGVAEIQAETAAVTIDFWALLSGRVQPRVVNIRGARITIRLPVTEPGTEPLSLETAELRLRQVIGQVTGAVPNLQATMEDARVQVLVGDRAPLILQAVNASVGVSERSIDVEFACTSNLWEKLALAFTLSGADLGGTGRANVVGLQTNGLYSLLGLAPDSSNVDTVIIGRFDWRMQGLRNLSADLIASAAEVTLRRGTNLHVFSGVTVAAGFQSKGHALEANLHRLYLRSPHLLLSGKLARSESGAYVLEGEAMGVDVDELLAAARDIAPEIPWIAQPPFEIDGGNISALRIGSHADARSELLRLDRLQVEAALEGVGIDFTRKGIRIRDVDCRVSIDRGVLRVRGLTARLGQSVVRNARLVADLLTEPIVLNAETEATLELSEALVLAKQMLPASKFRSRLNDLEQVKGTAIVRLAMEGSLKEPRLRVDVQEMNLVARHRAVPMPVRLSKGQAGYTGDQVSLHALDGHIGDSSFTGLDASFGLKPPHRFNVRHERAALLTAELFRWAASYPDLAKALAAIRSVSGKIELSGSQARGSFQNLEDLLFSTIATPRGLVVLAPDIGPELKLDGGVVEISQREVEMKGVGVAFVDAALSVSGHVPNYRERPTDLDVIASGKLGAEAVAWIYNATQTPRALQVRAPIEVADVVAKVRGVDDVHVKGRFSIAGGPVLGVEGRRVARILEIDKVTVKDLDSDASFGGKLAYGNAEGWFKGRLSGKTLPQVFVAPAYAIGELRGDLAVKVDLARIAEATARGHLEGSGISVARGWPTPIEVEKFALEADNGKVVVKQADVSSGENRIALTGTIERRDHKFVVDAELRSDRIVMPQFAKATETADEHEPVAFDLSKVPFEGRVAVNVQKFKRDSLEIDGLIADAKLADAKVDLGITNATVCGINLSGTATGGTDDLRVIATLRARDAPLAGSIDCLTGEHIQASGQVDLDAQFTSQGALGSLKENLDGTFSVTARDGHLQKAAPLQRVFELLNVTEAVRGEKLELGLTGLPYRTMSVRGAREGKVLRFEEMTLDAPVVQIVASGRIDTDTDKLSFDVLVAPLQTANYVLEHIPLLNKIFGGSVLAVPVQVSGTLTNPVVVPLGPGAVARRLTDIIGNVLKLPADAITIISPGTKSQGKSPPDMELK
ncbi:MAG TPA: AsmA-like C-terminal domain-containing protein [Burkholderiales bacterium]|nr:AsmA-like C-terminal domain-containing protein [Burkholderiales bacterium]